MYIIYFPVDCARQVNITLKERDLGLTISADMKVSVWNCSSEGKPNFGLIRRNIMYKEK